MSERYITTEHIRGLRDSCAAYLDGLDEMTWYRTTVDDMLAAVRRRVDTGGMEAKVIGGLLERARTLQNEGVPPEKVEQQIAEDPALSEEMSKYHVTNMQGLTSMIARMTVSRVRTTYQPLTEER